MRWDRDRDYTKDPSIDSLKFFANAIAIVSLLISMYVCMLDVRSKLLNK